MTFTHTTHRPGSSGSKGAPSSIKSVLFYSPDKTVPLSHRPCKRAGQSPWRKALISRLKELGGLRTGYSVRWLGVLLHNTSYIILYHIISHQSHFTSITHLMLSLCPMLPHVNFIILCFLLYAILFYNLFYLFYYILSYATLSYPILSYFLSLIYFILFLSLR
jgi:hypothetical protein